MRGNWFSLVALVTSEHAKNFSLYTAYYQYTFKAQAIRIVLIEMQFYF